MVIKDLHEHEQGTMGVKIGEKLSTAKLNVQGVYQKYGLKNSQNNVKYV